VFSTATAAQNVQKSLDWFGLLGFALPAPSILGSKKRSRFRESSGVEWPEERHSQHLALFLFLAVCFLGRSTHTRTHTNQLMMKLNHKLHCTLKLE